MRHLLSLLCAAALTLSAPAETFEVGKGTFLLNGEPFVVKAAEVHYPRIPESYWEHRIRMCKALGMNTLCLYVFWNFHEREPGVFDFSGNADVAKFCRLAQKHGLYVIVRPGPYVCAEWEMGGLPWWLLQKEDIRLRTNDPYYLDRVGRFLKRLGQELAPLQLARGGNIIMVQVENEYGAYATDKTHVANIRDLVRAAGFTDVPLFQCDWSSTFKRNGLGHTRYYIRDNTPRFSRIGEDGEYNGHRLAQIIEYLYPGAAGKFDRSVSYPVCLVSDRSGQLKLIEYSYTETDGTTVTTVRPCPVHYLGTEPDADFSSILKVKVKEPHDTQYFFY